MPEDKSKENILRKVRALFRLAEDEARRDPKVAEQIAARANELLLKFAIDRAEVEDESPIEIDAVFIAPDDFGEQWRQTRIRWTENLAHIIAKANFCVCTVASGMNAVCFYGRESEREIAKYVFCKMARIARALCEKELAESEARLIKLPNERYMKAEATGGTSQIGRTPFLGLPYGIPELDIEIIHDIDQWRNRFKVSFHDGFLVGLQKQFDNMRKMAEAAAVGNALIFMGALAKVEEFVNKQTGGREAEEIKEADKYDRAALAKGLQHGETADTRADGLPTGQAPRRLALPDARSNDGE